MRNCICCVLACFLYGACVSSAEHCQGPLQPINPPQASTKVQTPLADEPDGSRP